MEPTDEVFFVQNAGHRDAGTGMAKSAIIEKISLAQAAAASNASVQSVDVTTVNPTQVIPNPNGISTMSTVFECMLTNRGYELPWEDCVCLRRSGCRRSTGAMDDGA